MLSRKEFNELLKKASLTKKDFCRLIELDYNSVNNWGTKNISVPKWVESWLENYIEKTKYEKIKAIIKDEIV